MCEHRNSLGKCSTFQLHPQPHLFIFSNCLLRQDLVKLPMVTVFEHKLWPWGPPASASCIAGIIGLYPQVRQSVLLLMTITIKVTQNITEGVSTKLCISWCRRLSISVSFGFIGYEGNQKYKVVWAYILRSLRQEDVQNPGVWGSMATVQLSLKKKKKSTNNKNKRC